MAAAARVVETHVSYVFFVGEQVYKLKKPVATDVLDFSTPDARRRACEAEVALNRRLAPDVYEGLLTVTGPDTAVCDYLVAMRRMPENRQLATLVVNNDPTLASALAEIALVLAKFHESADRSDDIDTAATAPHVAANWKANSDQLRAFGPGLIDQALVERVDELAQRYVETNAPRFDERVRQGRVVDGHGDLLADDIFCLDDGPRILDCLEFDPQLRYGDALADVAFLAMDLERLGRPDLAEYFLGAYRRASGDQWPDSLRHHWVAYRAQVRAKIACLRAMQGDSSSRENAKALLQLADRHLEETIPRVILVGGLPGTGKSTLAQGIGGARQWPVLRSDVIRKELAGLAPLARAAAEYGTGLYRAELTAETYVEMLRQVRLFLRHGESVVLDASWTSAHWRKAATELAREAGALLIELRCVAPALLATDRIRDRAREATDPSDANEEVAAGMALQADPWPAASVVDTSGPPEDGLDAALLAIYRYPALSTPGLEQAARTDADTHGCGRR